MKKILSIFIVMFMAFSLAACRDNEDVLGGGGIPPTLGQVNERMQDMPQSSSEGEIESAITEVFGIEIDLPDGTYSAQPFSYGGVSAYVVTVSDTNTTAQEYYNSIKAEMLEEGYTAEEGELTFYKVVGAVVYSVSVEDEGGDIIVVSGANSISSLPSDPSNPSNPSNPTTPSVSTTWPASQIEQILGTSIPPYTGAAESFSVVPYNVGGVIGVSITISGAESDELYYYMDNSAGPFRSAGFTSSGSHIWAKSLENGDTLVIPSYSQTWGEDGPDGLSFTVYIERNTGLYSTWPSTSLAASFSGGGTPSYEGGTSFDFNDLAADGYSELADAAELIVQSYEIALQYGFVNDELEAQYQEALAIIEDAQKVSSARITVYNTNDNERQAYITKILASPDRSYEENFIEIEADTFARRYTSYGTEYEISITVGEVTDGKLYIDILKMPVSLVGDDSPLEEPDYNIPENVKIVYNDGIFKYTIYKIGENYYKNKSYLSTGVFTDALLEQTYYKKNGSLWDIYNKDSTDSEWSRSGYQETGKQWLEQDVFDFIIENEYLEGGINIGTQTILGKTCDIYECDYGFYKSVYYVDADANLVMMYEMWYDTTKAMTYEVTLFDTNVTSFDIELPQ